MTQVRRNIRPHISILHVQHRDSPLDQGSLQHSLLIRNAHYFLFRQQRTYLFIGDHSRSQPGRRIRIHVTAMESIGIAGILPAIDRLIDLPYFGNTQ